MDRDWMEAGAAVVVVMPETVALGRGSPRRCDYVRSAAGLRNESAAPNPTLLGERHGEPDLQASVGRELCRFPSKVDVWRRSDAGEGGERGAIRCTGLQQQPLDVLLHRAR